MPKSGGTAETPKALSDLCWTGRIPAGAVVTGPQSVSFLSLPYLPESICIEVALGHLGTQPDLVLSLGGESFVVYCMASGSVRRMMSSNRCAAGSGEFLVQQFGRMNLDLTSGIAAARLGRCVTLASRCSVHCKSDATHKLNKGGVHSRGHCMLPDRKPGQQNYSADCRNGLAARPRGARWWTRAECSTGG
jgi:hypothetical protein